jgi:transcriptional regulator with XRE-family HTH domain
MVMTLPRRRLREPSAFLKDRYCVSIGELAARTGLDRTTLNAVFVGRRQPMYATMVVIAEALDIRVGELAAALQEFQDSCTSVAESA